MSIRSMGIDTGISEKGLPVAVGTESLKRLAVQGYQNQVFEFESGDRQFILKELNQNSANYFMGGLERLAPEKAGLILNQYYRVVKKYFGDHVVDTFFFVANNREGKATVVAVQPKIVGDNLKELAAKSDGRLSEDDSNAINELIQKSEAAIEDAGLDSLPE